MIKSALFAEGNVSNKNKFLLSETRRAHDRITNLLSLTNPLLVGAWSLRKTAEPFIDLSAPENVKDALMNLLGVPKSEKSIRRLSLVESIKDIEWDQQKNSLGEMMLLVCFSIFENYTNEISLNYFTNDNDRNLISKGLQFPEYKFVKDNEKWTRVSKGPTNYKNAFNLLSVNPLIKNAVYPSFPMYKKIDIEQLFDRQVCLYRVFKEFRNGIVHGELSDLFLGYHQYVSRNFKSGDAGVRENVAIKCDSGVYSVDYYNVIGFLHVVLKMISYIDSRFLISEVGVKEICRRLSDQPDSKKTPNKDKNKQIRRLKKNLEFIGAPGIRVNWNVVTYFSSKKCWISL